MDTGCLCDCWNRALLIFKGILARSILVTYSCVAVWRVTETTQNKAYWLLMVMLVPVILEMVYLTITGISNEFKWIAPNVIFFILCVIPCIWIMELTLLQQRLTALKKQKQDEYATTTASTKQGELALFRNNQDWVLALEQILIFALVLAKWIAPKGRLSLDDLSKLLLVYIGVGVDIVELFASFENPLIRNSKILVILILMAWSWSLMQFMLVFTATKVVPVPEDDFELIVKIVNFFKFATTSSPQIKASAWSKVLETTKEKRQFQGPDQKLSTSPERPTRYYESSSKPFSEHDNSGYGTPQQSETKENFESNRILMSRLSSADDVEKETVGRIYEEFLMREAETNEEQSEAFKPSERRHSRRQRRRANSNSRFRAIHEDVALTDDMVSNVVTAFQDLSKRTENPDGEQDEPLVRVKRKSRKMRSRKIEELTDLYPRQADDVWDFRKIQRRLARYFNCFCFYNEIWAMTLSLVFQDIPFFMVRILILFYYRIVTRLIILFVFKNFLNVLLVSNRIRTIFLTERKSWLRLMEASEERGKRGINEI